MRVVFLCGGFKWANSVGLGRAVAIGPSLDGLGPPALDGFWGTGVPMGVSGGAGSREDVRGSLKPDSSFLGGCPSVRLSNEVNVCLGLWLINKLK